MTTKEKSLHEMSASEIHAGLKEYFQPEPAVPDAPLPPGVSVGASQKEIDAAGEAIMRKPAHLLSTADQAYIRAASVKVLLEGW